MQPSTNTSGKSEARVQTSQGQQVGLREVKAIRLGDGWHSLNDVELNYETKAGSPKTVPFSEIQGFSDQEQPQG